MNGPLGYLTAGAQWEKLKSQNIDLIKFFTGESSIFNFAGLLNTIHHLEYVSRTKSILFLYYIQSCTGMWLYKHENVEC